MTEAKRNIKKANDYPRAVKRVQKPTITPSVEVILWSIPFLNCDEKTPMEEIRNLAVELLLKYEDEDTSEDVIQQIRLRYHQAHLWNSGYLEGKLRHTRNFLFTMLRIGLGVPVEPLLVEAFQHEISEVADRIRLISNWVPGETWLEPSTKYPSELKDIPPFLQQSLTIRIADGIKSGTLAFYVGICPRCGKVFERKRVDQKYCGKTCGFTTRTQRRRGKI